MSNGKSTQIYLGRRICSDTYLIVDKIDESIAEGYPDIDIFKRFSKDEYPDAKTGMVIDTSAKKARIVAKGVRKVINQNAYDNIWKTADEYDDPDERLAFIKRKYLHLLEDVATGYKG